jgi:hypothetical protein
MKPVTPKDLEHAAEQLSHSGHGRQAMADLLTFLDNSGLSLDCQNRNHVLTLLSGAWGCYAGTARDVMRDIVEVAR